MTVTALDLLGIISSTLMKLNLKGEARTHPLSSTGITSSGNALRLQRMYGQVQLLQPIGLPLCSATGHILVYVHPLLAGLPGRGTLTVSLE